MNENIMNKYLVPEVENARFKTDKELFERMLNFISDMDPEQLDEKQLDTVLDILESLEPTDDEDEIDEVKKAKRSSAEKKRLAKQYWRKNKAKIKRKRAKFKKSAAGKQRKRKAKIMAKSGKTATGRRKVSYHR